jgi:hypothetical protein
MVAAVPQTTTIVSLETGADEKPTVPKYFSASQCD